MAVDIEIEVDTEMDTEIEMVMEIDAEIDTETETEIHMYGDIVVANFATSPIRSRLAMTRWKRHGGIPFGFRKAMGRKGAAVAAAFHR